MSIDFNEVVGMARAKRALEIAAAGGHNIFLSGPAGSGRTMLAKRLTTILPELTDEEDLAVTRRFAHGRQHRPLGVGRPFRSPHYTISTVGLMGRLRDGGGYSFGEIDLARDGVLLLDELPEFRADVQKTFAKVLTPDTLVVGAMTTCPCGHQGTPRCSCSDAMVINYHHKVTEDLFNRFDMRISVEQASYATDHANRGDSSAVIRERVTKAREIQIARQGCLNSHLDDSLPECHPQWGVPNPLHFVVQRQVFNRPNYRATICVARTIADLAGEVEVTQGHFNEALRYV